MTSVMTGNKRNEELFVAAVEFLSKKYKIDNYTLVTKNSWHIDGNSDADLDMKRELAKVFQK